MYFIIRIILKIKNLWQKNKKANGKNKKIKNIKKCSTLKNLGNFKKFNKNNKKIEILLNFCKKLGELCQKK